jgi:hypothetical protein
MKDAIVLDIIKKFTTRSEIGMVKYNTTLQENNKDNYLIHLQEELMDACLYLQKLMKQREEISTLCSIHSNDTELGNKIRKIYG